ncbi:MAG TPA: hypothetical protein DER01_22055 [Phycisphaerales bacterium]|nr:hypothetical protein [Phycisphaerales bacterium]|tara:strand:+ start:745 stop:1245 length:501 start_codon:yes stop_codon:yes gene_type:complete
MQGQQQVYPLHRVLKLVLLALLVCLAPACSDASDPQSYVGTWNSGFDQVNQHGHKVDRAWQLVIDVDERFVLRYRDDVEADWSQYNSGKIQIRTVNVDGFDRPGISFGVGSAWFYAGGMHADMGFELREFKRAGGTGYLTIIVLSICLLCYLGRHVLDGDQRYQAR